MLVLRSRLIVVMSPDTLRHTEHPKCRGTLLSACSHLFEFSILLLLGAGWEVVLQTKVYALRQETGLFIAKCYTCPQRVSSQSDTTISRVMLVVGIMADQQLARVKAADSPLCD